MKRMGLAGAALSALALSAGQAAADGTYQAPAKAATVSDDQAKWSGPYIASSVGYADADAQFNQTQELRRNVFKEMKKETKEPPNYDYAYELDSSSDSSRSDSFDFNNDGVIGTIAIGYDRELRPGFVVGVFADYTFGELDGDASISRGRFKDFAKGNDVEPAAADAKEPPENFEFSDEEASLSYDDTWAIGARLGFVHGRDILWYVTAGYTQTKLEFDSDTWGNKDDDLDGYFLGAGVERQLHSGWSLKLEYRYSDFDDARFSRSDKSTSYHYGCGGDSVDCSEKYYKVVDSEKERVDIDTDIHSIRLGVAYKFDLHREAPAPLK